MRRKWISWWRYKNELSLLKLRLSKVGGLAALNAFAKQYRAWESLVIWNWGHSLGKSFLAAGRVESYTIKRQLLAVFFANTIFVTYWKSIC